jgi:16S rRNA (cytosine967-C5)-methyltransferase
MRKTQGKNAVDKTKAGARAVALKCLLRWAKGGVFAETLVAREAAGLSASDRALVPAIVLGCLRNMRWLEHISKTLRPTPMEDVAHWLVLLGLCQLFVLGQAEHAAVCETVAVAPARLRGLVNGILRNAVRRRAAFESARASLPLGVRYSAPDWLVKRWVAEFGADEAEQMLAWNVQAPPVYVRLNPLRPMEIPEEGEPLSRSEGWYRLPAGIPTEALQNGNVYVADPSTRYCVELLQPQAGERILDACAAPGGKSAAMLAATGGQIQLLATDSAEHRLPQLKQNLERAGGVSIEVACHDWSKPCPPKMQGAFDAVLLDVPCSNSGVLQRRVDARWRLTPQEFERLAVLQSSILDCACAAVRPGGRLVYSTCSIDGQEDRGVVDAFLVRHPEFKLERDYLALPHREQSDGAYAALLIKSV